MNPDLTRVRALQRRLQRTLLNVSAWWGVPPDQATAVLGALRDDLISRLQAGTLEWPDPAEARYNPGMANDELRELAYAGAAELASQGIRPSGRNLWKWCRSKGARKRESDAVRIVGGVVASLASREVAAAFARVAERIPVPTADLTLAAIPNAGGEMGRHGINDLGRKLGS